MIPFFNLEKLHEEYVEELKQRASTVIESSNYIFGTEKFEAEFAEYTGASNCACVASGTAALHLALMALDIQKGDEVITVGYTFKATVSSIMYVGATPVYIDIDKDTFCMDPSLIESKITDRTKCIIPVHLFGNAVDMNAVMSVANKYNIPVIEDCAQAHGTTLNGKHVGTFGIMGAFSFYPSKNVGALGDGGCVITNDLNIHKNISALRSWKEGHVGYNYRMDNLQTEFLSVKLKYYPKMLAAKSAIAAEYNRYFNNIKTISGAKHSYNIYTVLVNDREQVIEKIKDRVQTRIYYPIPVNLTPPFIFKQDNLHLTNALAKKQLSLPIYPTVDYQKVIAIFQETVENKICNNLES